MNPLQSTLDKIKATDCSRYVREAEREKCEALSALAVGYQADMAKLAEVSPGTVFTKTMKLNQYRDNNWLDNYQTEAKKGQIKKIEKNLNEVVRLMRKEYNSTRQIANVKEGENSYYSRLLKDYEDILAQKERSVDASEDSIALSSRLVSINNAEARWKDLLIYLLQMFFVVVLMMVPVAVGYWSNAVTARGAFGVFAFLMTIYLVYVCFEIYYIQGEDPTLSARLKAEMRAFNRDITHFGDEVAHGVKQSLRQQCHAMVGDPRDWNFGNPGYLPVRAQV